MAAVAARERDCPFSFDLPWAAMKLCRALSEGPFALDAVMITLQPEQPVAGQNLNVISSLGCFGRPLPDSRVTWHVVLQQDGHSIGSVEREGITEELCTGRGLLFQNFLFRVPPDAPPGRYTLWAVVDVDGFRVERSTRFELGKTSGR